MPNNYFKFKSITINQDDELDQRSVSHVIDPIVESYFFLPTREKLNDPNEGIFQNQIQTGITAFLQGLVGIGERTQLARALYDLANQISQSTDNSGVFSLSSNITDELMWAHYAASHCGIAIEYNLDHLTRFCLKTSLHRFRVEYVDEPPSLDIQHLQNDPEIAVRTMLGHKSPRWSHEQEYRVLLENIHGQIPHDYRAVKSITFGLKVPEKVQKQIYEATKHKVPKYYEIAKIPGTYQLERRPLEALSGMNPTGKMTQVEWKEHFTSLNDDEKKILIEIAQHEIDSDPHFEELILAEKSTTHPSKAVIQYEATHHLGLRPWSKYTKHYYDLEKLGAV
jgi:DUF2971 family protein